MALLSPTAQQVGNGIRCKMRFLPLALVFATLAGCQSAGRIAVKATPSLRDADKYDFSVEFIPSVSLRKQDETIPTVRWK